ncbi:MAG: tyrosine-type recombinase/integrase [Ignavibacteria bacterium]|nr:tyrosine-type recombinase/integrase [Ignavibacteria bacterium]
MKKEIVTLEKENKMKIKYGAIVPKTGNESIKLSEAKALYLNHIKKNRTDKKDYHTRVFEVSFRQFSKIINPERRISTISKEDIIKFRNSIWNELSNATVRTYLRYLKGFFNYLVEYDYLEKSPVRKGISPKSEIMPIKIFNGQDINRILEKANERDTEYYKIYKILLLTGMRPCDLFTLKAGNFDLQTGILQFKISKTQRTIEFPLYQELRNFVDNELLELKQMSKDEKVFKKYNVERIGKHSERF